jgi:hypothetical protein
LAAAKVLLDTDLSAEEVAKSDSSCIWNLCIH